MEMTLNLFNRAIKSGVGAPVIIIVTLAMLVVPMPPVMLDMLFTFNIALSLMVLLATVYIMRPLDFEVFPTVILMATLLRLSLNVASTRVVLFDGHTGPHAAGQVIEAFGNFVIGGNFAVGLVVFTILIIINFVVVTKGAGRISEVSARFVLDAMPGKQMAIDADLNSGFITQEEARKRREEIQQEADFYGSMDGASKFVRGDAIAGILILFANIFGGLFIGSSQHGLSISEAFKVYTLLTVGDGLVAQIPALLLSTGSAIVVTRMSRSQDMGKKIYEQLFGNPTTLYVTCGIMGIMGVIPGMPNVAFLTLSAAAGGMAYLISRKPKEEIVVQEEAEDSDKTKQPPEMTWDDVGPVEMISVEVGYRLVPLVDRSKNGELLSRIKGVRNKLSQELGFLLHSVHVKDNLNLNPNAYRIKLKGVPIAQGEVYPEKDMAINPGNVTDRIDGFATKDPAFGMDAVWIDKDKKEEAQEKGYAIVDASTVVATHISHIVQKHAHEIFGHEEAQHLLDGLAKKAPKLVESLTPAALSLSTIAKVLQNLLSEGVSIRDIRTIAESLVEHSSKTQDSSSLTEIVRSSLGRMIVQSIIGESGNINVMAIDPALENMIQNSGGGKVTIEPGLARQLQASIASAVSGSDVLGVTPILLVAPPIRAYLSKFLRDSIPSLNVLSYNEIPSGYKITVVSTVGGK